METFAFTDLLGSGNPIRILARVSLLTTAAGGRTTPFTDKYRPNHNFGSPDSREFYIGQINVPADTLIYPGETHDLYIIFLNGVGLNDILKVGRIWRIQEGNRLIANAKVLEVLEEV